MSTDLVVFIFGSLHFYGLIVFHKGEVVFHFEGGRLPFWGRSFSILGEGVFHFGTIGYGIDRHTYRQSELQKLLSGSIFLICPSIYNKLCTNLLINHNNLIILLLKFTSSKK